MHCVLAEPVHLPRFARQRMDLKIATDAVSSIVCTTLDRRAGNLADNVISSGTSDGTHQGVALCFDGVELRVICDTCHDMP